jgi:cold shock CspA family protein
MQRGVGKLYNPKMGYGVVAVANDGLVMVHDMKFVEEPLSLWEGQEVTLEVGPFVWGGKGMPVAFEVRPAQ